MVVTSSNSSHAEPVAQTTRGSGASSTPATAPRGSAGPLRIPFPATAKQIMKPKAQGKTDKRGKDKGVSDAVATRDSVDSLTACRNYVGM